MVELNDEFSAANSAISASHPLGYESMWSLLTGRSMIRIMKLVLSGKGRRGLERVESRVTFVCTNDHQ